MDVITDIPSLRRRLGRERSVAFVPTMGGLHAGHLSLVRIARQQAECVVASVFVNRLQFLPGEDFDRYPRTLGEDCRLLQEQGADVVFTPDEAGIYPVRQEFMLQPPPVAEALEGRFRPGFFRGVATVVLKLFNIVQPRVAVFGKKDYQQLHLMCELVRQLNLPIEIVGGETVRAPDGLALSSRNRYLNNDERMEAARLHRTLLWIRREIEAGGCDLDTLQRRAEDELNAHGWKTDYVAICRRDTLAPAAVDDKSIIILAAAWLGSTRLIDNLEASS